MNILGHALLKTFPEPCLGNMRKALKKNLHVDGSYYCVFPKLIGNLKLDKANQNKKHHLSPCPFLWFLQSQKNVDDLQFRRKEI